MKLREYTRNVRGARLVEISLEPRKSVKYYWKALISTAKTGEWSVKFYDRFGEPYSDTVSFNDLVDAKIHVRRMLLNQ